MSKLFDKALQQVPEDIKSYVDNSFDIVDQIYAILKSQGRSQKDLADLLKKKESEISKWMQGTHNFTIRSISRIEDALGKKIITTPQNSKSKMVTRFIPVHVHNTDNFSKQKSVWHRTENNIFKHGLKSA